MTNADQWWNNLPQEIKSEILYGQTWSNIRVGDKVKVTSTYPLQNYKRLSSEEVYTIASVEGGDFLIVLFDKSGKISERYWVGVDSVEKVDQ